MDIEFKEMSNEDKPQKVKKSVVEDNKIRDLLAAYSSYDWSQFDSYESIPLSDDTRYGLTRNGFTVPTDIQKQSIGPALNGKDVLGAAKTGSGKTLAFIVPILEILYCNKWTQMDGIGALVITPTRELSYQIFEVLRKLGTNHDFSAGLIIGGKDLKYETKRLDKCNIIICTPGRLLQHMDENPLFSCDNLKVLVLDEADRCLDMGFAKTMNAIIENLPQRRQTLLFSATQTKSVKDLARLSLKDPIYVWVHENEKHSTPDSLTQSYIVCELEDKLNMLWSFLRSHTKQKVLVFMSSCKQVKYCYDLFCRMRPGVTLLALYGTLHQLRRMSVYDEFCRKQNAVLFATDIASRGLDFPSVNWVLQLDCPEDVNTYIHRVGRTARYLKGGESLLVLLPTEEHSMVKQLTDKKIPITKIEVNPKKMHSIQRKAEAFLARDPNLKECAQRAFKSYVKNVFLMKDKTIFDVKNIDSDLFSRSLGLAITPRIRFIEKSNKNKVLEPKNKLKTKTDDIIENNIELGFNDINNDEESDDNDLFSVKKVWRFDLDEDLNDIKTELKPKDKKIVTKTAVAKKVLKKHFKPNIRVVFNEEGEVAEDFPTRQVSDKVRQLDDKDINGIDIEIAKEIMKDEDIIDKKLFKDLVKAKHKEKRLKLKEEKRKQRPSGSARLATEGSDDDNYNVTNDLIDALPDPDVIYGSQSDEDNSNDSNEEFADNQEFNECLEESDDSFDERDIKSENIYKRNAKQNTKQIKRQRVVNDLDLNDCESLANHLLNH